MRVEKNQISTMAARSDASTPRRRALGAVTDMFSGVSALAREKAALEETNRRLMREVRRLERLAYVDALTGLGNRRHFEAVVESELARAARSGEALTLLLCDVDRFKDCNDRYGHDAGDAVLVDVGQVLKRFCRRGGDLAVRYAGDEFALLLPGVARLDAEPFAGKLLSAVAALSIRHPGASQEDVSMSIGGATFQACDAWTPAKFFKSADEALYRAKRAGRNRFEFSA